MTKDIRWKQRFQDFEGAYLFLKKGAELGKWDDLQSLGVIKAFRLTFEMCWQTLKEYLREQGVKTAYPRETIKHAFSVGLIEDGTLWIQMLTKNNELAHMYDIDQAKNVAQEIKNVYAPLLKQIYDTLKEL